MHFRSIERLNGVFKIGLRFKFNDSNFSAVFVTTNICEANATRVTEEILQVLPVSTRRKIASKETVIRIVGRRESTSTTTTTTTTTVRRRWGATITKAILSTATTAISSVISTTRELHRNSLTIKLVSIKLLEGVFGIAAIFVLHKCISLLNYNIAQTPIASE